MGKKMQEPIYLSQKECDTLERQGYCKEGPRKDSKAADRQSKIGSVPKGYEFASDQRKGMLAQPKPEENQGMSWLGAAGVALGVGAALFGGYQTYKHFTSEDQGSSKTERKK